MSSKYNVNLEKMERLHGKDKGLEAYKEIADRGGFGTIGEGQGQIHPNYTGGLDIAGVLSDANTAVSSRDKDRIAELAGVERQSEIATESSASKQEKKK
jgi:hypothetical protein